MDIIATTTLVVKPGTPFHYHWENYGLTISVPANALDPQAPPMTIHIMAKNRNSFQLPHDTQFVSGIYSVTSSQKLSQPVVLELQHCANLEDAHDLSSLSFVATKCSNQVPPYMFQQLPGGKFSTSTSNGSIGLRQFCEVAIVTDCTFERSYRTLTFYQPQETMAYLMHIVIIWDLDLYFHVCNAIGVCTVWYALYIFLVCEDQLLGGRYWSWSYGENRFCRRWNQAGYSRYRDYSTKWVVSPTITAFHGTNPFSSFVSFYHYLPFPLMCLLKLQRSHVDGYQPNQPVPYCQIQLHWTRTDLPHQNLEYWLNLQGTKPKGNIKITRNCPHQGKTYIRCW